jgi:hypothetical protein
MKDEDGMEGRTLVARSAHRAKPFRPLILPNALDASAEPAAFLPEGPAGVDAHVRRTRAHCTRDMEHAWASDAYCANGTTRESARRKRRTESTKEENLPSPMYHLAPLPHACSFQPRLCASVAVEFGGRAFLSEKRENRLWNNEKTSS